MNYGLLRKASDVSVLVTAMLLVLDVIMFEVTMRNPSPNVVFWTVVTAAAAVIAATVSATLATVYFTAKRRQVITWIGVITAVFIQLNWISLLVLHHEIFVR